MSGGVDSSVTAAVLKRQGYQVIGVHLQLWNYQSQNQAQGKGRCCSLVDAHDAQRVCDLLDIPYYVLNAQDIFRKSVVDYFVDEYLENRTPNPCVQCNQKIKFHYLFQKADELGCRWVATGHYAQVSQDPVHELAHLYKGLDDQKDQTYFLFGLTQKALKRTLMPLGGLKKPEVRESAQQFHLAVAHKPDSQEICFVGREGYARFIEKQTSHFPKKGMILDIHGNHLGEHIGLHYYTIGQRKRVPIQNHDYFVVGFHQKKQALIVGPESFLLSSFLIASNVNWIQPFFHQKIKCLAKVRSRHLEAPCEVSQLNEKQFRVKFDEPQRAITPGQAIVFYQNNEVLGGGWIQSSEALEELKAKDIIE